MTRLRFTFLALALMLLLPLGLLVSRALVSLANERELRHQIVAERIFDEMERELTALVRREEDRPFEHYRSYYVSESSGTSIRSPLADPPDEPFILDYFLESPDGSLTSPRLDDGAQVTLALMQTLLVSGFGGGSRQPVADQRQQQVPGTTLSLSKARRQDEFSKENAASDSYLSELNRGAASRSDRVSKLSRSVARNVMPYSEGEEQEAYRQELEMDKMDGASQARTWEALDVVLESLVGQRLDERHLALYRSAVIDGATYRQGLVVDAGRLVQWLAAQVLAGSELANRVEVMLAPSEETSYHNGGFRYRHQFAEPFGSLASLLTLAPLPEAGGVSFVYVLSALTLLMGIAGLVGIYRMVTVRLAYAERRQNFVSAVSHELKTPLTAIRMYGEMLRDGLVSNEEKRQHYYEVITNESERLTRLVNNVLELSKLERRDRSLSPVAGPLLPVLEEAREVVTPHAADEGFAIDLDVAADLPDAIYDRDALLQVLFNLIDNAVKYSKSAQTREILLRARQKDDVVEISVSDQGPGVSEAHLKHIFEPFYRAEAELTRRSRGTGIGLALVRGLIESMGGSVRGENGADGGFVVRLTLPVAAST